MKKLLCILLVSMSLSCAGQGAIDSLTQLLENRAVDSAYVDILNQLSFEYLLQDPANSLPTINKAIEKADSLSYDAGLFRAILNKGGAYWSVGLPDLALKYYLEAESILVPSNHLNNSALYNNIGEVFKKKEQFDSAIPYFRRGIGIWQTIAKPAPPLLIYNLGEAYLLKGNEDSARHYFDKALALANAQNHARGKAYALSGLADLDIRSGGISEGIEKLKMALALRKQMNDQRGVVMSYLKIATASRSNQSISLPKNYLDSALSISSTLGLNDLKSESYKAYSDLYSGQNDFKNALWYINKHYQLKDSLSASVFIQNIDQMKTALMSEIQQAENKLLKEHQERIAKETQAKIYLISGIAIVLLTLGLFFYQYNLRKAAINSTATNRKIIKTLQEVSQVGIPHGFAPFLKEVLTLSADTLGVERAIYWEVNPALNQLRVTAFYSSNEKTPDMTGYTTPKDKFKKYLEGLTRDKVLTVEDTRFDKIIAEFDKDYLKNNKIRSLMDVEIRSERTFIGVLSFEQTNASRKWSLSDQRFASSLSNIISSAYLLEENKHLLVELLEKNQQLRDSTFTLSHNLREPLSQILGFTALHLKEKGEADEVWKHLDKAAKQIDKVVRELTKQLIKEER